MTETEDLRARLNARGINWEKVEFLYTVGHDIATKYRADNAEWLALEDTDESLNPTGNGINVTNYRKPLTPEQAIDATLGRGTCHLEINTSMTAVVCDRCNYPMPRGTVLAEVHYCPSCGAEVVE